MTALYYINEQYRQQCNNLDFLWKILRFLRVRFVTVDKAAYCIVNVLIDNDRCLHVVDYIYCLISVQCYMHHDMYTFSEQR